MIRTKYSRAKVFIAVLVALASPGCSDDTAADIDRNTVLADLAQTVFLPEVRDFDASATALATATTALCDSPTTEHLEMARAAWRTTRLSWKRVQVFQYGPIETLHARAAVDWYPIDPMGVEAVITGTDPITVMSVGSLGANRRGLPGIEVVLFANVDVATLRDSSGPTRRCQYLLATTASVSATASAYRAAWEPTGGNYAHALATAGQGAMPEIPTTREAVDAVVNQLIGAIDILQVTRLAGPNGARNGGTPEPSRAESIPSGNSTAELTAAFAGIQAIYSGDLDGHNGRGISDIVASRSPSLDSTVRAQLTTVGRSLAAMRLPVDRAVTEDRARVSAAIEALTVLKRTVRVDVANALGVTVGFTDNDGD